MLSSRSILSIGVLHDLLERTSFGVCSNLSFSLNLSNTVDLFTSVNNLYIKLIFGLI